MEDYVAIGYTQKAHGVQGEIKIEVKPEFLEDFFRGTLFFIEIADKKIPYFIEKIRGKEQLIVKLEDINTREKAKVISSKAIYLRQSDLLEEEEKEFEVAETSVYGAYVGFELKDKELGLIGTIEEVVEYPQQELAVVNYLEKERLIPLNEQFITSIDVKEKVIHLELPEGLLAI